MSEKDGNVSDVADKGLQLLVLAERCEAAAGPDFELDLKIAILINGKKGPRPLYTASLDAAMSLVPEGWQCDGLKWWAEEGASCVLTGSTWDGENWVHRFNDGRVEGSAFTAALALCAAALRARASRLNTSQAL